MSARSATTRLFVVLPLLATLLLAGCASDRHQQRLARFSAQALYDRGQKSLRAHDYAEAVAVYEALNARYPFAPQSRQGRLNIIFAYYKLGEKESAKDAAETFIRENPADPQLVYAWYLKGLIDFERTPYSFERWLGVNLAERPPDTALDSFKSLRTVVQKYPKSVYAHDARRRMIYMRNRLADFELIVAHHYEERSAWIAAAQRARQAIEQYDGAPATEEALRVLVRCYRKLDYKELADNTEKVFHENFPNDELGSGPKGSGHWWKFWGKG